MSLARGSAAMKPIYLLFVDTACGPLWVAQVAGVSGNGAARAAFPYNI